MFAVMSADLEKLGDALVNLCLEHPQYFYAAEVLGPACMELSKCEGSDGCLAGEHA